MKMASFWKRLVGSFIDSSLIALMSLLLELVFELPSQIGNWLYLIIFYLYNILCDFNNQPTLGKLIMKLKVIRTDGQKPELKNAIYRNLGKIVSALPFFYGFLRILAPHQQQTMHDELGKCLVIEKSN